MKSHLVFLALVACSAFSNQLPPLQTVSHVDLNRYLGIWYEIARLPNSFEASCVHSTAEYTLNPNGELGVLNTCFKGNGYQRTAKGIARVTNRPQNSKLKVNFVPKWLRWTGLGWGDYWIIDLGEKYEYSVVSEPNRDYLWILSRTPSMSNAQYQIILHKLLDQHFDLSHLIIVGEIGSKSQN